MLLSVKPTIYLDCCVLQRVFDDHTQPRIAVEAEAIARILKLVENDTLQLVASEALWFEVDDIPDGNRKEYCQRIISNASHYIQATSLVADLAKTFSSAGLNGMDALHLASAVSGKLDYFCTCDDRFLTRARQLNTELTKVVSVLEFLTVIKQ